MSAVVLDDVSWLLDWTPRPSRRRPGTVKWSPTPTASHEIVSHLLKVQRSGHRHLGCLFCVQRGRLWPRSVGIGPCLCRAFLLMVWVCSHLIPAGSNKLVAPGTAANEGGPISTETRVNERIRVPEVRLIGPGGAGRHCAYRRRTSRRRGRRSRPCRSCSQCQTAGLQDHGLRQVQVRGRAEGARIPQKPTADRRQRTKAATKD